ncbi:MAG: tetratricopeptide repeat protein [Spongiibacteraceae bacterium]|nr:tetratricopeptide repeat protein [Spongiibacteraceae bacterium]
MISPSLRICGKRLGFLLVNREYSKPMDSLSCELFISYTAADVKWAKWVEFHLSKKGYQTTMQLYDFPVGSNFILEMHEATDNARTIALLSTDYLASAFCQLEWAAALREDPTGTSRKLIPLRVCDCHVAGILGSVVYADLFGENENAALERLFNAVEGTDRPLVNPGFPSVQHREGQRFPGKLPAIWNVPYNRNPHFTGRDGLIEHLAQMLSSGKPAALNQALSGLGGVGKTQLAVEYCFRYSTDYECIWWLRSEDAETLASDYAALATELQLEGCENQSEGFIIQAVRRELDNRHHYLLIFDNVEEPESLQGYLPQGPQRQIMITSRKQSWSAIATAIDICTFERSESVAFLAKRSGETNPQAANTLAKVLGDLPLALEQAAAFIKESGPGFGAQGYLNLYQQATQDLLKAGSLDSSEYPDSVVTTWKTTLHKLSPAARSLLRLSGFLAPDPIVIDMFIAGAKAVRERSREFEIEGGEVLDGGASDSFYIRRAVNELTRYSMAISHGHSFSIHRLVQTVERFSTADELRSSWVDSAINLLLEYAPSESNLPRTWSLWDPVYSQAVVLDSYADVVSPERQIALLDELARFNFGKERFTVSVVQEERAFKLAEKTFGLDSAEVESRLINFGESLRATGKYADAEKVFSRALVWREQHDGRESVRVAVSLNYLGLLMSVQDKVAAAKTYLQEGLQICDKLNLDTGVTYVKLLFNLGSVLEVEGDYKESEALFRKVLAITSKDIETYGHQHYWNLQGLGVVLNSQNNPEAAVPFMREAAKELATLFGSEHPNSLNALQVLAATLRNCGDYSQAEQVCRQVIDIASRVGNSAMVNKEKIYVAELMVLQGQHTEEVLSCFSQGLKQAQADKGDEHPDTVCILDQYAEALYIMGRLDEALLHYRCCLAGQRKRLGDQHVVVAQTLNLLAVIQRRRGRLDEAELFARESLCIDEGLREAEDPKIAFRLKNLSTVLMMQGKLQEALRCNTRAWELSGGRIDVITGRILLIRVALCWLGDEEPCLYLGQLKTLLAAESLPLLGGIAREWRADDVIDYLRASLTQEQSRLLAVLVAVLNNVEEGSQLEGFSLWKTRVPVALDVQWSVSSSV